MSVRHPRSLVLFGSALVIALVGCAVTAGTSYASSTPVYYNPYNAGYGVSGTPTAPGSVSVEFKIPTLKSCPETDEQIQVGAFAEDSSDSALISYVQFGCDGGKPVYQGYFNDYGTTSQALGVKGGETVIAQVNMASQNSTLVFAVVGGWTETKQVSNDTAAIGYVGTFPAYGGAKDKELNPPDFGKIGLKDATIDGQGIGTYTSNTAEYIRTNNGSTPPAGTVQVEPGTLKSSSFPVRFVKA